MSAESIVKCGHCDGKGVCERGKGNWSCSTCTADAGYLTNRGLLGENGRAVKCSICGGTGSIRGQIAGT
jgi:DnaJ-class molecular chaperone